MHFARPIPQDFAHPIRIVLQDLLVLVVLDPKRLPHLIVALDLVTSIQIHILLSDRCSTLSLQLQSLLLFLSLSPFLLLHHVSQHFGSRLRLRHLDMLNLNVVMRTGKVLWPMAP